MKFRILAVDDDLMITNSLKRVLSYEGYDIEVRNNGNDGLEAISSFKPDLVILDVMMPGMTGLEVCKKIKGISDTPVLFLSARDEVADRVEGLEKGGDDYLIKPFAFEELLARVKALLRRAGKQKSLTMLQYDDLTLNTDSHSANRNERKIELSSTEYQLLFYFMSNPGRVLTKDMILEQIWGYDFDGESNIVEVYIRYLRNKLEQNGESRLIHTLRGTGYILESKAIQ